MNRVQKGFCCLIKMVSFHVLLIRVALALPCEINLDVNTTIGSAKKRKNIKRILNKCYPVNRPLVERGTRERPEPVLNVK